MTRDDYTREYKKRLFSVFEFFESSLVEADGREDNYSSFKWCFSIRQFLLWAAERRLLQLEGKVDFKASAISCFVENITLVFWFI